jgi:PKD repeat protein
VSDPLEKPVASFNAPATATTGSTVAFTDTSTGTITSWAWDFDNDGVPDSTEQNPTHTYTVAGNYTVNLTVANAGGSDSEVRTEYIAVSKPLPGAPVADFTANQTIGTAPFDVQFTDVSTGTVSSYAWDFDNDGNVDSNEQNPVHTYAVAGNYTVNLTVTGSGGSDSEVKTGYINVSGPSGAKPVAAFSASPTSGNAPLKVQFTDKSTGTPTSWKWNFGDGNNSTEKNPAHTYNETGTYNVSLTVKNVKGTDEITKYGYITVDSSTAVDPVCKMKVDKATAKFTSVYKGTTYYFCSASCKEKFDANPEKYINS